MMRLNFFYCVNGKLIMAELEDLFEALRKEIKGETKQSVESILKDEKKYSNLKSNITKNSVLDVKSVKDVDSMITNIPLPGDSISKKKQREEREKTSGDKWFDMPTGNFEQNKKDLLIIQQRAVLDPKRHYKKDKWKIPKYFQMGTVVEDKSEFYSARLKNKERQQTILQEVLHNKDSTKYFKRKYGEIQDERSKIVKYKRKSKKRY